MDNLISIIIVQREPSSPDVVNLIRPPQIIGLPHTPVCGGVQLSGVVGSIQPRQTTLEQLSQPEVDIEQLLPWHAAKP